MAIRWPIHVLAARDVAFDIASRSIAAPASVSGVTQVAASDAGIWKATLGGIVVHNRDHVLVFRAIANLLEGRLSPIIVPFCRGYQPVPDNADYSAVPHSDGSHHSDGTGYVGSVIDVELAASAAARAVSATVDVVQAGDLHPGQHFSIGDRLYRLRSVAFSSETRAAITFRPPLRSAAPLGTKLNFDDPVCRMRLASDGEMDLELGLRRFGNPTVNFIEDL